VNRGPLTGRRPSGTSSGPAKEDPANTSQHAGLSPKGTDKPPPLRTILTKPVLITIASYAMLALLTKASIALIPLVWSTSVELGGLGLSPASIGLWVSVYGSMSGIVQYFIFPRLISHFGPRGVVLTSVSTCALVFIAFPFENLALRHASSGLQVVETLFLILQLSSLGIAEMGTSKSMPSSLLNARTDVSRTRQAPYSCTFPLPFPISDLWALRMASRRQWCRSNA
jgi:hypothetical protein